MCYNDGMQHTLNPKEIRYIFDDYVASHRLVLALSLTPSTCPWGYDPEEKTLHVNPKEMAAMPDWAGILYLLHALTRVRLLVQTDQPEAVVRTAPYVLEQDGRAYKLHEGKWLAAKIQSKSVARAAKSLPAHVLAVQYAMEEAEDLMTSEEEKDNLHRLAYMMQTGDPLRKEEIGEIIDMIDRAVQQ